MNKYEEAKHKLYAAKVRKEKRAGNARFNAKTAELSGRKKPRRLTTKGWIRLLDELFRQVIRKLHRSDSCPFIPGEPANEVFHFLSRSHYKTRWDLRNAVMASSAANIRMEHDAHFTHQVAEWYIARFGKGQWESLHENYMGPSGFKASDYEAIAHALRASFLAPKPEHMEVKEESKVRCPYGCLYDPVADQYHIAACRDANKP